MRLFMGTLSKAKMSNVARKARALSEEGRQGEAWSTAAPLVRVQARQREAAETLIQLIAEVTFERPRGAELATALLDAHSQDLELMGRLGQALESVHDLRYLNAEPPPEGLFHEVAERLSAGVEIHAAGREQLAQLEGLATVARILGRRWDEVAESACSRVVELVPDQWQARYALGLFYKTRGRFAEGQAANQAAFDLGGADSESVLWNLGICATGADDGETALRIWTGLGQKLTMGRFGLPEGGYPSAKVRLAQRPLAERGDARLPDAPGEEETIWIERLSPCHGVVRNALYEDSIGVDFGDVVLHDGAVITHHLVDEQRVPVFPHLSTLRRADYLIVPFRGTQSHGGQLAELSDSLAIDAELYVHTEQHQLLCRSCWESPQHDHSSHDGEQHRIVSGKLCAPPSVSATELLRQLDRALTGAPGAKVLAPALCRAAGDPERAEIEERRLRMLESA